LALEDVSIALRKDRADQPVLDLNRFGSLELRGVTLQNSGKKPAVRANDGKLVVLGRVTCKPPNEDAFDLAEVKTVRRP
jgi:hypothetical protein